MKVKELIKLLQQQDSEADVVTSEAGRYINTWHPVNYPKADVMRKSPQNPYHYYRGRELEEGLTDVVEI